MAIAGIATIATKPRLATMSWRVRATGLTRPGSCCNSVNAKSRHSCANPGMVGLRLPYSMRQEYRARARADQIPRQIPHAEHVAGRPLVVNLPADTQGKRDSDRTAKRRSMVHAHRLERAVRNALDERRDKEVLD